MRMLDGCVDMHCQPLDMTRKPTKSMFCIMFHIIPIPWVVLQAMLHVSTLYSCTLLHTMPTLYHLKFHRDYHVTFLLFSHHHSIYTTYVRQSQSLVSQLITSDQGWVTFLLPLSCFYHILWFISEFSIVIPHPSHPLIIIIVLYSVSFLTLLFLLFLTFLVSNFLAQKPCTSLILPTSHPPLPHFKFKFSSSFP